jgi:hypothetical protein
MASPKYCLIWALNQLLSIEIDHLEDEQKQNREVGDGDALKAKAKAFLLSGRCNQEEASSLFSARLGASNLHIRSTPPR